MPPIHPTSHSIDSQLGPHNFELAFHCAAIGMALVALDGHFLQVNRALCDLTGYDQSELLGLTFEDITYPEDLRSDLTVLRQLLTGQIMSYRLEKRYIHKAGYLVWVLLNVSLIRDSQGHPDHFVSQIQDITERHQVEADLLLRQRELQTIVENVPDIIVRYDRNLRVLYMNPSVQHITGRDSEAFLGKTLEEANSPASVCAAHRQALERVVETSQVVLMEYSYENQYQVLHYQMRMVPEFDNENHLTSVLCVSHDVTGLREIQNRLLSVQQQLEATNAILAKKNEEWKVLAFHDSLTGVANRRAFDQKLSEAISHALRHDIPFSLALLDIDHFKRFNDSFGHGIGDQSLRQVARLLEATLRPMDVTARYGGEEFALIFNHTSPHGAAIAAERCRQAIKTFPWPHAPVTASVGVDELEWRGFPNSAGSSRSSAL